MQGMVRIFLVAVITASLAGCDALMERTLKTGPNGPETPASVGVPYQRVSIASGPRRLDGYLVKAPERCTDPPAVVIYHGVGETISLWVRAQKLLYDHCVSSLVFDYTGNGNSSPHPTHDVLEDDAVAAFGFARQRFAGARLFALGHSMGNGILLEALPRFERAPKGIVLANAFASLRAESARSAWYYAVLSHVMPDWWNNVRAAQAIRVPVLVVAGDGDHVVPPDDSRQIFAAAPEPKHFVILHGYGHNALYKKADEGWWKPVVDFFAPEAAKPVSE